MRLIDIPCVSGGRDAVVRPKCKLPDTCTISHLIGKTVTVLREADMHDEMQSFIDYIKQENGALDYSAVLKRAEKYVDFS